MLFALASKNSDKKNNDVNQQNDQNNDNHNQNKPKSKEKMENNEKIYDLRDRTKYNEKKAMRNDEMKQYGNDTNNNFIMFSNAIINCNSNYNDINCPLQ